MKGAEALRTGGPGTCKFPGMGYIIMVRTFWVPCQAGLRESVVNLRLNLGSSGVRPVSYLV